MTDMTQARLLELLHHWQAFSELQQLAFEFLAEEAINAGQEFERSTDGATGILTRLGQGNNGSAAELLQETFQVVHQLQAADRSRQGLEQVASVLTTLRAEHADLVQASLSSSAIPTIANMREHWITAMASNISLADWRRRLVDALHGIKSSPAQIDDIDDELF